MKLSIICLQETWLTENSFLSGLQIEGYELIFQPARCSFHAGLAFYLSTEYKIDFLDYIPTRPSGEGFYYYYIIKI